MQKEMYVSPEFEFQEMKLAERVADKCWGYGYGWYDVDEDGTHDPNEEQITFKDLVSSGQCKPVEQYLVDYLNEKYELNPPITGDDVKTNSDSKLVRPITSM